MISKKKRFILLSFITTQICACHPGFFMNIQPQEPYQPSIREVESLRQTIHSLREEIARTTLLKKKINAFYASLKQSKGQKQISHENLEILRQICD